MSNQRPNTVVILFLLVIGILRILGESILKGVWALFTGKVIPLKNVRPLRLWHWGIMDGPKKFWRSPSMTKIGRLVSTVIQVVFYPQK